MFLFRLVVVTGRRQPPRTPLAHFPGAVLRFFGLVLIRASAGLRWRSQRLRRQAQASAVTAHFLAALAQSLALAFQS